MALDLKYHNHINQEYGDKTRLEKDHVSNEKPVIADQRFYKPALFHGEAANMMMEECL